MRRLFISFLAVTVLMTLSLQIIDYVIVGLWGFSMFPYFWGVLCMIVVMPWSLVCLLLPSMRKQISVPIIVANLVSPMILILVINSSQAIEICMSV